MGRKRQHPVNGGKIVSENSLGNRKPRWDVERRIGLHNLICMKCNANNHENADKCRKCGRSQLRKKHTKFRST